MTCSRNTALSRTVALLILTGIVLAALPPATLAVTETGAPALEYPLGARSAAMGYSGVADRSDPSNLFFNPANVTAVEGVWSTGAYELLAPGFAGDVHAGNLTAGGGYTVGNDHPLRLAIGITLARISFGTSIATAPDGTPLGEFEYKEDIFGATAGVAGTMGERLEWALGLALKRWKGDYAPAGATILGEAVEPSKWMVDAGAVVSTRVEASDWSVHPALAVAAVNMGSDIELEQFSTTDPLPTWFNYGISVRVDGPAVELGSNHLPVVSVTLNADGNHGLNDQRPRWGFGYEATFMEIVSARWGRRTDDSFRQEHETWGLAVGLPAGPVRARFEYTSLYYPYLFGYQDLYGVTLMWLFGER